MNTLTEILLSLFGRFPVFANVATGTHEGCLTKTLEQVVTTRYLLGKHGSSDDQVDLCGTADEPLGVITDEGEAGDYVNVSLPGSVPSTLLMVASEAIAVGEAVYTAASGKVQNEPASTGTYYQVGVALTAASGDGERLEVAPTLPRLTKVIGPFEDDEATNIALIVAALEGSPDKIIGLS